MDYEKRWKLIMTILAQTAESELKLGRVVQASCYSAVIELMETMTDGNIERQGLL